MDLDAAKADLQHYLRLSRQSLLEKLEGTTEYDGRRPLTATGTNLLGLIKHLAAIEAGYLGDTFGRPFPEPLPWMSEEAEDNADMWATAEESREEVLGLYARATTHADATVETLPLDATGRVPWWGDRGDVTLHRILLHVIAENQRHAGHADIVRELVDGAVGMRRDNTNLPTQDPTWWSSHRERLEQVARRVGGR